MITKTITSKISHLQKRIESILDTELETKNIEVENAKAQFEALTDPRLLRGLSESLPQDSTDKAVILFSRLSLYFDAGIFLELEKSLWEPQALFHLGHIQVVKDAQKKKISLPVVNLMSVLKTNSKPLLQKMNLESLDPKDSTTCLLIRPGEDFSFLLFSSLPDLWLKEHTRLVTEAIQRGLSNE